MHKTDGCLTKHTGGIVHFSIYIDRRMVKAGLGMHELRITSDTILPVSSACSASIATVVEAEVDVPPMLKHAFEYCDLVASFQSCLCLVEAAMAHAV